MSAVIQLPGVSQAYVDTGDANTLAAAQGYTDNLQNFVIPRLSYTYFDRINEASTSSTNGTEDDLFVDTITRNSLNNDGDKFYESELVTTVGSATASRRIKKYLGGNLIWDSGAITLSLGGIFVIETTVWRTASDSAKVMVAVNAVSASTIPYAVFTDLTGIIGWTGDVEIKTTGIAAGVGAANGDIINQLATGRFIPTYVP